jgi:hypothetical protein
VLKKLDTGGLFTCTDPAVDSARVARFEVSPAGPMFGHKLRPATGPALAREEAVLAAEGIALADFARGGGEAEGTRRAGRLPIAVSLVAVEDGYRASFELPRGGYAAPRRLRDRGDARAHEGRGRAARAGRVTRRPPALPPPIDGGSASSPGPALACGRP